MEKSKILLQNKNNSDRKIWIELPAPTEEIQEAINDICKNANDTYIINKFESDLNIKFAKTDDIYSINKNLLNERKKVNKIKIYTYCKCIENPGKSIWNATIKKDDTSEKFNGTVQRTTSNAIELIAIIEALKKLDEHSQCIVFTSSYYVITAIKQQWLENWKKNAWKTSDGELVKNKKLWLKLDRLLQLHSVEFKKI